MLSPLLCEATCSSTYQFPDNPGQVQVHSHLNFEGDAFRVTWNQSSDLFLISLLFGGGFQAPSYLSLACG